MEQRIQGGFIEHPENTCTRHCAWNRTAGLVVLLLLQCNKLAWQHSALALSPNCLALHFHISLFNYHTWDKENMRAMELNHVSNQKLSLKKKKKKRLVSLSLEKKYIFVCFYPSSTFYFPIIRSALLSLALGLKIYNKIKMFFSIVWT